MSGKAREKVVAWFGYKIPLLVDAPDEFPLAWTVTKASTAHITEAPQLLAQLQAKHPLVLKAARTLTADRGYDSTSLVQSLGLVSSPWTLEIHGNVKPVEPVPSFGMGRIIAVRGLPRQGSSRGRLTPTLTESTPDIKACG